MAIVVDSNSGDAPRVTELISDIEIDVNRNVFFIKFTQAAIEEPEYRHINIGIVSFTHNPASFPVVPFNRPGAKYIAPNAANEPSTVGEFISAEGFGDDGEGVYTLQSPLNLTGSLVDDMIMLTIFAEDERHFSYRDPGSNRPSVGTCTMYVP